MEDTSSSEVVSSSVPEDRTLEEIVGGLGDFGVDSAEIEKFAGMCFALEGLFVGVAVDVLPFIGLRPEKRNRSPFCSGARRFSC